MQKLANFVLFFGSLLLMNSSFVQAKCKIHDTFITYGDHFGSNNDPSSYWFISISVKSKDGGEEVNCSPQLTLLSTGDAGELDEISISPFETVPYYDAEKDYSRINYRFKVSKSQGSFQNSWTLMTTGEKLGPYKFPQMGIDNGPTTARMLVLADFDLSAASKPMTDRLPNLDRKKYDMVMHVGDFAYNIQNQKGARGDEFFDTMSQSFAREIPYVVVAGNHELHDKGRMFDFRFKMPNSGNLQDRGNHYYSFDYKGVHYVTIDWDYVFNLNPGDKSAALMWLKKDLENAHNNPSINFKVFFSHRPIYCPQADGDHCKIFFHTKPFQDVMT